MSLYNLKIKDSKGEELSFSKFEGKALLVVNTASKCGFTKQYAELEELYKEFKERDFEILAFPCNQFGAQEPGTDDEIQSFCQLNYGLSFPVMGKIDVNGENESSLFKYLKQEASGLLGSKKIKWNFTKFLISKDGKVIKRYAPMTTPLSIKKDIERFL